MDTQKQIESDFKDAMRASDDLRKRTYRMVLSSIKLAEVDKGEPLEEPDVLVILQKEIKSRRETIADAERAGRADIAAEAEAEIRILEPYLPQPLTHDEIEEMANEAIAEVGASSPKEMGMVMKVLMPRIQGRADGSQVSQIVRQLLVDE
ncbi:MAG: GatB/YqeY domain-containing protein [Anaerolineales bacterium]